MAVKTYGQLSLSACEKMWIIERAEPHVSIRLKHIFPKIPKAGTPPYTLNRTDILDADIEWFLQRYPLEISVLDRLHLTTGAKGFRKMQAELERILLPDYKPAAITGLREGQVIRPYQLQAIEVLRAKGRLLLGDEGGLGKTYTAAGFMCSTPNALPAAVVCDPHMQKQWQEKIEAFTHLRVHLITKTTPYDLPPADVYVFRISQASGWTDIFATGMFKSAIFDEPQSLRTGLSSQKGLACKVLADRASYRMGLTATPIYNYGIEMWNIMQFIDETVLGPWDEFMREWCGDGTGRIGDPKALGTYLREQHAMIRRLKPDVGQQLPKVSRIVEPVDYDHKAVEDVEALAKQLAIKATTGTFFERGNAARELDIMMRQVTGVAKAKNVALFTRMVVEAGEPVILWGWHREVYEIWNSELADLAPAMYTGSETAAQKDREKKRFIQGEAKILIMSLRSGAGIDDLQHVCSTGIFGELDWSPGIHQQCIWRLDREGQKNPVTAFFLVSDDGSDPPMMDVLGLKASEANQIIDPHLGVQVNDNDTSNMRRLVERYLGSKPAKNTGELKQCQVT
ncbi:MAG: SNF2-related protein [Alphaproteobacteria bacterium]